MENSIHKPSATARLVFPLDRCSVERSRQTWHIIDGLGLVLRGEERLSNLSEIHQSELPNDNCLQGNRFSRGQVRHSWQRRCSADGSSDELDPAARVVEK